jgi:enoyl-CoA hydratase/carnithine racemase
VIAKTMWAYADAKAIVLTGTGTIFSAGVDLRRVHDDGVSYIAELLPALDEAFLALSDTPRLPTHQSVRKRVPRPRPATLR